MTEQIKRGLGISDILGEKRTQILDLARQYGAFNVRVFGSVARGDATPASDVDFLVSLPADRSIFDLVGLWLELTELLGREVDVLTDGALTERMRENILKDATPL